MTHNKYYDKFLSIKVRLHANSRQPPYPNCRSRQSHCTPKAATGSARRRAAWRVYELVIRIAIIRAVSAATAAPSLRPIRHHNQQCDKRTTLRNMKIHNFYTTQSLRWWCQKIMSTPSRQRPERHFSAERCINVDNPNQHANWSISLFWA